MKKAITFISGLLAGLVLFSCTAPEGDRPRALIGPVTASIDLGTYSQVYYVSPTGSDDTGDGSKTDPWNSVQYALASIPAANEDTRMAVCVAEGIYTGGTVNMVEHIDLFGGFDATNWSRNIDTHKSVLDGMNKARVIVAADQSRIDGFVIANGLIRGKGAGILCDGVSPIISNNVLINNMTLSPEGWNPKYRHEISNDGCAIYIANNASPTVSNNLFAGNKTENGRGAGIALHNHCNGVISNNVFYNNVTGLDDPLRSSDGGAISIFDWSNPIVENNIILSNKSLANNDAGGVFIALWSSPLFRNNILVDNECSDDAGSLFIGGQEHRYDVPLDPIPPKEKYYVQIIGNQFYGNRNPSGNSGVMRMTMESRGIIANNIMAFNNGFYIQRSEAMIVNNTILENFLFIETKEGLKPSYMANNIVWCDFNYETVATVEYNNFRDGYKGPGNFSAAPRLHDDLIEINASSAVYIDDQFVTRIDLASSRFKRNELANRTIRSGDRWGVVKSNEGSSITAWGDLSGAADLVIIPTFRLRSDSPNIDKGTVERLYPMDIDGDVRPHGVGVDVGADEFID